ncbi:restriction endonuclease subunit S [Desulfosporosinus hippei]|uniref:Type I restriction enzyme, S subunit n=1 Tax=Desulfosporosinus hippei DSM 8344 TaxID=1121419 RepID=A0A1G8CAZ3_9FIRM|nr:restriction endonuclease subunit S [Desulfosporosinus hippei]SDH42568.1 type I restriction enzyme, S subunit [Desulfosporosinus hippei DSM 8344]
MSSSQWKTEKLGNIAHVQTGPFGSQLHNSDYVKSGTPIITVEHLGNRKIARSSVPFVCEADRIRLNKYSLKTGDLVFSRVGSVDRSSYVSEDENGWLFSGRCLRVRASDNSIYPKYLYYYFCLESMKEYIRSIAVGATMPSINTKILSEVTINYPPMREQKAIANTLSCLDDKVELNNRINQTLEEIAQAIFKNWFVDFEPFKDGEFEDSELGRIPKGWRVETLKSICKTITKGTTPTTLKKRFVDTGINFVKAESITDNHSFDTKKFAYIDEDTDYILKRSKIQENDILLTIAGTIGRFAMVTDNILPANTNQAIGIIRVEEKVINPLYVLNSFMCNCHKDFLESKVVHAVQANLSLGIIGNLPMIIPSEKALREYYGLATPIFEMKRQCISENEILITIRDALLPKLMSGEIRVTNEEVL